MLANNNGHVQIVLELFKWHESEIEISNSIDFSSILLESIELAKTNGHLNLVSELERLIFDSEIRKSNKDASIATTSNSGSSSTSALLVNYQDLKISETSKTSIETGGNSNSHSHLAVEHSLMDDFQLIDNLDDLASLLTEETNHICTVNENKQRQNAHENATNSNINEAESLFATKKNSALSDETRQELMFNSNYINGDLTELNQANQSKSNQITILDDNDDYRNLFSSFDNTIVNLDDNCINSLVHMSSNSIAAIENNQNMTMSIENSSEHLSSILQKNPDVHLPLNGVSSAINAPTDTSLLVDDDQDKKIKTLADNIIAAMPHKIKTNSYSTLLSQAQSSFKNYTVNSNCNKINGN